MRFLIDLAVQEKETFQNPLIVFFLPLSYQVKMNIILKSRHIFIQKDVYVVQVFRFYHEMYAEKYVLTLIKVSVRACKVTVGSLVPRQNIANMRISQTH